MTTAEMRLSEVVIIYLAVAAPFGVTFFLRRSRDARRGETLAKAAGAALVWPACLLIRFAREVRAGKDGESRGRGTRFDEKRVERAKRETINALRRIEDALVGAGLLTGEAERYAFFAAREGVERYAGLALACEGARADDAPTTRETELCRVAGRAGDDLLVAGRCFHRRQVARLLAHRDRARGELESALSAVREVTSQTLAAVTGEARGAAPTALFEAAVGAVKIFDALGDEEAAARTARLFGAGGAGLAELENGAGVQVSEGTAKGVRSCTTQAAPTVFANPPQSTATYTRG